MQRILNKQSTSILLPAAIGMGGVALSAYSHELYGWCLFIGLPFLVGFLAAFSWSFKRRTSLASALGIGCASFAVLLVGIILTAMDGLMCMVMLMPLACIPALVGAVFGRRVGSSFGAARGAAVASLLVLLYPSLAEIEHEMTPEPRVREVTTSVLIDGQIQDVWNNVIAFPKIIDPPSGILGLGNRLSD